MHKIWKNVPLTNASSPLYLIPTTAVQQVTCSCGVRVRAPAGHRGRGLSLYGSMVASATSISRLAALSPERELGCKASAMTG